MRQILLNSGGAVVARVPRPIVEPGSVLVRVRYSLISVGTEIAPLRTIANAAPDSSSIERGIEYAGLAPPGQASTGAGDARDAGGRGRRTDLDASQPIRHGHK